MADFPTIAPAQAWRAAQYDFDTARLAIDVAIPDSDEMEATADAFIAARGALMSCPAPDGAALLSKLQIVFDQEFGEGDDSIPAWNRAFLAQTMADCKSLLSAA